MKKEEQMLNITPERLAQIRREEARNKKEEEREASKPEWLKDKEKAESIGRFVLWLFSPSTLIAYILISIFLTIVVKILN